MVAARPEHSAAGARPGYTGHVEVSQHELASALAAVDIGVWTWDVATRALRWSPELCALFGLAHAPDSYEQYLDRVPAADRARLREAIEGALRQATATRASTTYTIEHRVVVPGGEERWLACRGRVVVDEAGAPTSLVGTAVDVSSRRRTEERLRESEALLRLTTELGTDYVYVVELDRPTLVPSIVAGSFERTTGMTPADVEARGGWFEVIVPADRAAVAAVMPAVLSGKPSVNEYRITDPRGDVRWLRDSVRPVRDAASGAVVRVVGGVQDITERKALEEQLFQAQKLEALARLSGGIAHDFNNLLAVIMGSVAVLEGQATSPEARECCGAILEATERGAELTRSLLMFARRDAGSPRVVALGDVVREAMPLLGRAVGPSVRVVFDGVRGGPHRVRIDPGQAQLLLLNLVVNARDAMPSGGAVHLAVSDDDDARRPPELSAGPYARLTVTDGGEGIPPELVRRVFEPFFTTKPPGKGTGLGLSACHGIVTHAGGAIHVESAVGRGTTFVVYLPLAARAGEAEEADPSRTRHSPGGTERVLVVEDEASLLRVLTRALQDRGYAVRGVGSAEEALEALAEASFDLIVSDLALPGLSGADLAHAARERWPSVGLVLMSGHPGAALLPEGVALLAKPFTAERLASQVRETLDAAAARPREAE